MTGYPEPEVGLVVSYAYLRFEEAERGRVEGKKNRPCAIVMAVDPTRGVAGGRKQVAVVPITHSPPRDPEVAIEIPARVKAHLGLDAERSWVVLDELNEFTWPGYDLRPISREDDRVCYGFLPPKLFARLIEKLPSWRLRDGLGTRPATAEERRHRCRRAVQRLRALPARMRLRRTAARV